MAPWEADADALHASGVRHLLLLSGGNAAVAQIAHALARALAPRQVRVTSAGIGASRPDPLAARVLAELSVPVPEGRPTAVAEADLAGVDVAVTLSADATVPPALPGARSFDWPIAEPPASGGEDERLAHYRGVRNELRRRFIRAFARSAQAPPPGTAPTAVQPAAGGDFEAIRAILASSLLPSKDVGLPHQRFVVAREDGRILGCAGLEQYGKDGQVRSLAVDWTRRNAGLGTKLHDRLLHEALLAGVHTLYVITATAEDFFERHGYRRVRLDEVPAPIRASEEFRTLAPASAACMSRTVRDR